jgi:hypothetical protein
MSAQSGVVAVQIRRDAGNGCLYWPVVDSQLQTIQQPLNHQRLRSFQLGGVNSAVLVEIQFRGKSEFEWVERKFQVQVFRIGNYVQITDRQSVGVGEDYTLGTCQNQKKESPQMHRFDGQTVRRYCAANRDWEL